MSFLIHARQLFLGGAILFWASFSLASPAKKDSAHPKFTKKTQEKSVQKANQNAGVKDASKEDNIKKKLIKSAKKDVQQKQNLDVSPEKSIGVNGEKKTVQKNELKSAANEIGEVQKNKPEHSVEKATHHMRPKKVEAKAASGIDGKIGTALFFMNTEPFGARTGYNQLFVDVDWDVFNTGLAVHTDFDLRTSCLYQSSAAAVNDGFSVFEPRNREVVQDAATRLDPGNDMRSPCQTSNAVDVLQFYAQSGTYVTGRTYDYLRIDQLNLTYDLENFGIGVGRLFIPSAQQAQVDGAHLHMSLGELGHAGFFAGLKPNPFHQQVVGASSGGFVVDGVSGEYTQTQWGTVNADPSLRYSGKTYGAYSNEIGAGYPWTQFLSARFLTTGAYTSLRVGPSFFSDISFTLDAANVAAADDAPYFQVDRVSVFTHGGWRIFKNLMTSWRATIDVIGAQPFVPRNVFLNLIWRDAGPISVRATYLKINTYATAASYFRFFRPLEQPPASVADLAALIGDADPTLGGFDLDVINNRSLFVVDRDRLRLEVSARMAKATEAYAQVFIERRDDTQVSAMDFGQSLAGFGAGFSKLTPNALLQMCGTPEFVDRNEPQKDPRGINATVPTSTDLCRLGAKMGLRNSFLGGAGAYDMHLTVADNTFAKTARASGRINAGFGVLQLFTGATAEMSLNERTYGFHDPTPENGRARGVVGFYPATSSLFSIDGGLSLNPFGGLILDLSYYGWVEILPDTGTARSNGSPFPTATSQIVHTLSTRATWRF